MPIVVKHEPSAAAVLGMSRIAGEGAFNKWKTEFEARQKQYAFQNLMSGISGGMGLAQPFIQSAQQQAGRDHQLAMYEKAQGDRLTQDQKAAKGNSAALMGLYNHGVLGDRANGKPWLSQEEIGQIVQNRATAGNMVQSGMGALRSTIAAQEMLDPGKIRAKVSAQFAQREATRAAQVEEIEKFQSQLLGHPSFQFKRDGKGGLTHPDPKILQAYKDLEARKSRVKLGIEKIPLAQRISGGMSELPGHPGTFVFDKNANLEMKSVGGAGGTARGGKTMRFPEATPQGGWPEDSTREQEHNWVTQYKDNYKDIRDHDKPDEAIMTQWRSQDDAFQQQINAKNLILFDEKSSPEQKAAAQQAKDVLQSDKERHLANRPAGRKSHEQLVYEAEEQTLQDTNLPPPFKPNWKRRPYGFGRQSRTMWDEPVKPNLRSHLPPGFPKGGTNRDAAAYFSQMGFRPDQIQNVIEGSYTSMGGRLSPHQAMQGSGVPPSAIQSWMQGKKVLPETSPGPGPGFIRGPLRQEGEAIPGTGMESIFGPGTSPQPEPPPGTEPPTTPAPGDPMAGDQPPPAPKAATEAQLATPVSGFMPKVSRIAGPGIANQAMTHLEAAGGPPGSSGVIAGVNAILNDPAHADELAKWVFTGRSVKDWPKMRKVFESIQQEEKAFARKTSKGGREESYIRFPSLSGSSDLGYSENMRLQAIGKRGEKIAEYFKMRRDRVSKVIEAAVKWSTKSGSPGFSTAAIPAPTDEEFQRLAEQRLIKAGDVIVQPPDIKNGVVISGARFVIVNAKAIAAARFKAAQRDFDRKQKDR